jgi:hypothetical protein
MAYSSLSLEQITTSKPKDNRSMNTRSSDQIKNVNFLDTNAQTTTTTTRLPSSRTIKKKKKGKYASSTESRRIVWENIVWPLILETNRQYFTVQEYRTKKNEFIITHNIYSSSQLSGGLVSLMNKGILVKNKGLYSIHYRLVPYMRKKVKLDYGLAARETYV